MKMQKSSLFAALAVVSLALSAPTFADEPAPGAPAGGEKKEEVKKVQAKDDSKKPKKETNQNPKTGG